MTMRDPDADLPPRMQDPDLEPLSTRRGSSSLGWILAAVLVLLGAFAFIWSATEPETAVNTGNAGGTASNTNTTAPAETSGSAATTGSGSSGPATNAPTGDPAAR